MADSKKELKIQLVNELIQLWLELQYEIDECMESSEITPQMEEKCMHTKTRIAQRKQMAKDLIGEDFSCNGGMTKVLLGIPSLDLLKDQSPIIVSNLRNIWHEAFIALNQLAGNLKLEKDYGGGTERKKKSLLGKLIGRG